jgi:hypothetical protein
MAAGHRFLKLILPARAYAAVKAGTKQWLRECPCGHKDDLWDAGGVRYKACGEPRRLIRCHHCGRITWHKIRKKTELEKQELK